MSTIEAALSRRDFLFGKKRNHPSVRIIRPHLPSIQQEPPHRDTSGLTRRQAICYGGIGIVTVVGVAAGILRPWEQFTLHPEIDRYYANLKSQKLYFSGEFRTDRSTTKWFNFANRIFDQNLAQITFEFFEDLSKTHRILKYKIGSQSIPMAIAERPRNQRVFFVIPENAAVPPWPDVTKDASTTGVFENEPYASFARVYNTRQNLPPSLVFTTTESAFTKAFSVESCQSSIQVSSVSPEVTNLAQEVFCNAYGSAFTLKQSGIPYDKYSGWAKDVLIAKDSRSPSYPLYILSKQEYSEIPSVGLVLR